MGAGGRSGGAGGGANGIEDRKESAIVIRDPNNYGHGPISDYIHQDVENSGSGAGAALQYVVSSDRKEEANRLQRQIRIIDRNDDLEALLLGNDLTSGHYRAKQKH